MCVLSVWVACVCVSVCSVYQCVQCACLDRNIGVLVNDHHFCKLTFWKVTSYPHGCSDGVLPLLGK